MYNFNSTRKSPGACTEPGYVEVRLLRKLLCNFYFFFPKEKEKLSEVSVFLVGESLAYGRDLK